jgi:hypothetical protein
MVHSAKPRPDIGRQIDQAEPSDDVRRRAAKDIEQHAGDELDTSLESPPISPGIAEGGPSNPGDPLINMPRQK